jgi:acetyl-CoA C-acetyltransferase
MPEAYIVTAVRTAGGRKGGALRDWHPADMAAEVLDALVARSGIDPAAIEDVIMGCVGQAGEQAFHIGRNAVLASSLPVSVPAVSIDRQCGSSQQAIQFAAQAVISGTQDVVIAAGVESMTRVPMGLPFTLPMQHGIGTGPFSQRIRERFGVSGFSQFTGAEMIAEKYQLRRRSWTPSPSTATARPPALPTKALSRTRSCRSRSCGRTTLPPSTTATKAYVTTPALTPSQR